MLRKTVVGMMIVLGCNLPTFAQSAIQYDQVLSGLVASIARTEQATLKDIDTRRPLVETYLQTVQNGNRTPSDDHYYLSRVKLGQSVQDELYDDPDSPDRRTSHRSVFHSISKAPELAVIHAPTVYDPHSFVEMLSPEIQGFDPSHYDFSILREEYLGEVRTTVLSVEPRKKGMFRGRIWVEGDGHIVRFMGIFGGESRLIQGSCISMRGGRMSLPACGSQARFISSSRFLEEHCEDRFASGDMGLTKGSRTRM